jgi:hypothetical protein
VAVCGLRDKPKKCYSQPKKHESHCFTLPKLVVSKFFFKIIIDVTFQAGNWNDDSNGLKGTSSEG